MKSQGAFCEMYGDTIHNKVLEYLLENKDIGFVAGDMAKQLSISRPKAYEFVRLFEKKGYVRKARIMGNTQVYMLDKQNKKIKMLIKHFMDCLKLVAEEHQEYGSITNADSTGMVSASNI